MEKRSINPFFKPMATSKEAKLEANSNPSISSSKVQENASTKDPAKTSQKSCPTNACNDEGKEVVKEKVAVEPKKDKIAPKDPKADSIVKVRADPPKLSSKGSAPVSLLEQMRMKKKAANDEKQRLLAEAAEEDEKCRKAKEQESTREEEKRLAQEAEKVLKEQEKQKKLEEKKKKAEEKKMLLEQKKLEKAKEKIEKEKETAKELKKMASKEKKETVKRDAMKEAKTKTARKDDVMTIRDEETLIRTPDFPLPVIQCEAISTGFEDVTNEYIESEEEFVESEEEESSESDDDVVMRKRKKKKSGSTPKRATFSIFKRKETEEERQAKLAEQREAQMAQKIVNDLKNLEATAAMNKDKVMNPFFSKDFQQSREISSMSTLEGIVYFIRLTRSNIIAFLLSEISITE